MRILILSIIFFSLILSGCGEKPQEEEKQNTNTPSEQQVDTSKIVLKEISGKEITLHVSEKGFLFDEYKGKVVVLNFFATWCPPCIAEIPHLNSLQNRYKDQLQIVGVLLEEKKENEEIISFMNANNIEYTITNSDENFRLANQVGGVQSIPYMIIYDKDGNYFKHYMGAIPEEMIEADLKKVF
jgi:thiol-disulfide isomerase/thioredoxin